VLELPLQDDSEGYRVKDIEGLDPVKATLVSSSFANVDGEQYYSSRREARNIVIKLGIEANSGAGTGRQLRSNLYTYFMPKSTVTLRFYEADLGGYVDIEGVVETLDCPLFAQELEATISIMCHNPDFVEPEMITVMGWATTTDEELLIEYNGTIETGFIFRLMQGNNDFDLPEFTIYHRGPDNVTSTLEFTEPLTTADVVEISTVTGAKRATWYDSLSESSSSILYGMSPQSNWIQLFPGKNYIRVAADLTDIPYWIEYVPKHGGL
jgi:hypothetical protein